MSGGEDVKAAAQVRAWLRTVAAESDSATTLAGHTHHAKAFLADVAEAAGKDVDELLCSDLTAETVSAAIAEYRLSPDRRYSEGGDAPGRRSNASVARRCSTVRSLLGYLVREEHVRPKVLAAVPTVRPEKRATKALTLEAAQDVLSAARLGRFASRDTVVVALTLTMGLSLKEVADLKVGSVEEDMLRVSGKRGRERVVALSPAAKQALDSYLPEREALLERKGAKETALVVSTRERPKGTRTTLATSYAGVGRILERTLKAAGLEEAGWKSHALRATFATLALTSGSHTVHEVQAALGHSSLAAVRGYVQVAEGELLAASRRHPLGGAAVPD